MFDSYMGGPWQSDSKIVYENTVQVWENGFTYVKLSYENIH